MEMTFCFNNIILIGMPNSGKSYLGRFLSKKLEIPFMDSDDYLSTKNVKNKSDWNKFRKQEGIIIHKFLQTSDKKVIATGGGCIENVHLFSTLLNHNDQDVIIHIINHNHKNNIEKNLPDSWDNLWEKRAKWYFALSNHIYWNDGSEEDFLQWFHDNFNRK